jgi:phosphoglycolate phosphatase-like HAD superfamily hydrolase
MSLLSRRTIIKTGAAGIGFALFGTANAASADPLPSWKSGPARQRILDFVAASVAEGSPGYVKPEDRIAVFDNDGTLWCEQPAYFQLLFSIDRIRAMAPEHPEWKDQEPYKSVLAGDFKTFAAQGEHALLDVVMQTHAGTSVDEFQNLVREWLQTAEHPRFKRRYDTLIYQPMLELLALLRSNGYETWIVSGGGIEFIRAFGESTYGIPPQQVVGSSIITEFKEINGKPQLVRLPKIDFIDDKAGKPVGINKFIGKRPVFAAGNSDGDYEMLKWTTMADGPRFGMIVHHTDAEREYAYDRDSHVGRLNKALDDAPAQGWEVVSMKDSWSEIFPEA